MDEKIDFALTVRMRKAQAMAALLLEHEISADQAARMTQDQWDSVGRIVAQKLGIKKFKSPSGTTQTLTLGLMRQPQRIAAALEPAVSR